MRTIYAFKSVLHEINRKWHVTVHRKWHVTVHYLERNEDGTTKHGQEEAILKDVFSVFGYIITYSGRDHDK
jgi:hypothetical protein